MKKYDKLVRDRILEIIESKGENCKTHIANREEFIEKLDQKLLEETQEFLNEKTIEEMADLIEVLKAQCKELGFDWMEVEKVRQKKFEERGGFSKGIILEEA